LISESKKIKKEAANGDHGNNGNSKKVKREPTAASPAPATKPKKPESNGNGHELKKVKTESSLHKTTAQNHSNGKTKSTTNLNGSTTPKPVKKEVKNETKTPVKNEPTTPSKNNSSVGKGKKRAAETPQSQESPKKRKKKEEEEEVWKWYVFDWALVSLAKIFGTNCCCRWEEKKYEDGRKWTTLEHKGPLFEPDYTPLPDEIHFFYDSKRTKLSTGAEEVMTFYAKMLDHDYTKKEVFNTNFFKDWRKVSWLADRGDMRSVQ
jgi:hypothetical protein